MSYTPRKTVQYAFRNCVNCETVKDCRYAEKGKLPDECHLNQEINVPIIKQKPK
jgi:hypothetical protein